MAAAADQQNLHMMHTLQTFTIGDHVWLSDPTAGKLDPQWKENWTIKSIESPAKVELTDGRQSRVVQINCVQRAPQELQNIDMSSNPQNTSTKWDQPLIDHMCIPSDNQAPQRCYPQ